MDGLLCTFVLGKSSDFILLRYIVILAVLAFPYSNNRVRFSLRRVRMDESSTVE
jgi:hypothetical protein